MSNSVILVETRSDRTDGESNTEVKGEERHLRATLAQSINSNVRLFVEAGTLFTLSQDSEGITLVSPKARTNWKIVRDAGHPEDKA